MALRDRVVRVLITGDASGFKKAVGDVDKAASGLSGKVRGALAGVGIAAIGKGILDTANKFKDAALEVDKFRNATGLSAVEASKAVEAFNDLGVDTQTLQSSIGKMSKTLGKSDDAFKKYGIQVVRANNGTVDVNRTFINALKTLKAIEDPTKRAAAATDLFGRSWQELAPIIGIADQLETQLNQVGDAQIFDDSEIDKARKLRDAQNELSDSVGALQLNLAEGLIPALTVGAGWLSQLDPKVIAVVGSVTALGFVVSKVTGLVTNMAGAFSAFSNASAGMKFTGLLGALGALLAIEIAIIAKQKEIESWFARNIGGWKIWSHIPGLGGERANFTPVELKAAGGPVSAGSPYIVGEQGPELFVPNGAGSIIPTGAGGVNLNFYGPTYMQSEADIRALMVKIERERSRQARGGSKAT